MIEKISEVSENKTKDLEWFEKEYKKAFVDLNQKPKSPEGILSIGENTYNAKTRRTHIFTKGELSVISAPSKSFKSTFKSHLAAAFFTGTSKEFNEIQGHRKRNETVIDVDTEQGAFYSWHTFNRTNRIANLNLQGAYFPFKLRHMMPSQRVDFIDALLLSGKIKNPALIFIDGIADLIEDTNDLVISNQIINKIMRWTDELNIHVNVIIHNAYGTKKPTGHLGSVSVKKAETVININEEVDQEGTGLNYFGVTHQYSRGASFDKFYFKNDTQNGRLQQVDESGIDEQENIY